MENIKALKDYGLLAALVFVVTWQNNRINEIERRLYECFEARMQPKLIRHESQQEKKDLYAILPEPIRLKKEKA